MENVKQAAEDSADTFCSNTSSNLLNVSEKEIYKECVSQFVRGAQWQREQYKPLVEMLKDLNVRYIKVVGDRRGYNDKIDNAAFAEKAKEIEQLLKQLNID